MNGKLAVAFIATAILLTGFVLYWPNIQSKIDGPSTRHFNTPTHCYHVGEYDPDGEGPVAAYVQSRCD